MDFEFDAEKSASNKDKHGIDFVEAQALWHYNRCLIVPAKSSGELRFALIAKLGEKHWVAFYTLRGDTVRIISVRRARETWRSSAMKLISAEELDKKFDDGEDISEYLDWSSAHRPNQELTRVDFDLPVGVLRQIDAEAQRLGVTRQSLIKLWIAERLSTVEQR